MALRVLVIDDDLLVRQTVQRILERDGTTVICAENGHAGLEHFKKMQPDLVICDIIMPEKEGIETIMEIRKLSPQTPVIAISGGGRVGNADFLRIAKELGANEVVPKPFEPDALRLCIRRCLETH